MSEQVRDHVWAERARSEISAGLVRLPEVELEALDCAQRFCRALFSQAGTGAPDVGALIGSAPFSNEGFTLRDEAGRTVVYFGREGESLDALRSELSASSGG